MPIGTAVDHKNLKRKQRMAKLKTAGFTVALGAIVGSGVFAIGQARAAERKEEAKRQIRAERIHNYVVEGKWQLPIPKYSNVWDTSKKPDLCNEMQVEWYKKYLDCLTMCIVDTQQMGRDWAKNSLKFLIQVDENGIDSAGSRDEADKYLAQRQLHMKVATTMETIWEKDAKFRKANYDQVDCKREEYLNGVLADIHQRQADADNAQRAYQYQKQNQHHGR